MQTSPLRQRSSPWVAPVAVAAVSFALATTGCDGLVCGIESRNTPLTGESASGTARASADIMVGETKGGDSRRWIVWGVKVVPFPADPVIAVRLRTSAPLPAGKVLYELPLRNPDSAAGVVTLSYKTPYEGSVRFEEVWEVIGREPTVVEIVLAGGAAPISIPLQVSGRLDWHPACD